MAISEVSLRPEQDAHWIKGGPSTKVCTGDIYDALRGTIGGPPMADANWNCFAPKKVKIFSWVLRHDRT
nr:unnamed protein product [Digitaria exilis]